MFRRTGLVCLFVFCLLVISADAGRLAGPVDASGEINGAPFQIKIPAQWNGILLVYGHAYRDKADRPDELNDRNADVAPSAALVAPLLAQGYALAGTAYRDNGWEIKGGIQDMKDLTVHFRENYGVPDKTIIWAFSISTIIAFESIERFGGIYDGALCACAVGAGATQTWDGGTDFTLAYETLFGFPGSWGSVGDIRDDIDFESEVLPKVFAEMSSPANFPKFEFIRLVTGIPGRGVIPPPPPNFYPGWVLTDMYFATEARAELERRAGGPFVQNIDRDYNLTPEEKGYLMSLGIPSADIDGWLIQMNAGRTISSPMFSRNYVKQYADYSGKIKVPVLTMHTIIDPLITVSQSDEYAKTVANVGNSGLLKQLYTNGNGHCAFTGPQLMTALAAISSWVQTGVKPEDSRFPSALGFDQTFVPPAMLQP